MQQLMHAIVMVHKMQRMALTSQRLPAATVTTTNTANDKCQAPAGEEEAGQETTAGEAAPPRL